jgi:hypothetical protein
MTESEIILTCQIVFAVGVSALSYSFGYFEGRISAFRKVADDTKSDAAFLRQLFPRKV